MITRHILAGLLLAVTSKSVRGQAFEFDAGSYTVNAYCTSDTACLTVAIPGVTAKICAGDAGAPCSAPAKTFTSANANKTCAAATQLVPPDGSPTGCIADVDSKGDFRAWLRPGSYRYYLRLPPSASGKTLGPFSFKVRGGSQGYKSDARYSTLSDACNAAGAGTLTVSRSWSGLRTSTYGCKMLFIARGTLKPDAGQTVKLTASITAPLEQIFDLSAGGAVVPMGAKELYPQWFGAKGDLQTNDSAAVQQAEIAAAAAGKPLHFTAATYGICNASVTTQAPVENYGDGANISRLQRHSSCLQAHSDMLDVKTTAAVALRDLGVDMLADGKTFTNSAINITNAHGVKLQDLYVAHGQVVGLQCDNCSGVSDTGSTYYQNWWFGKSVSCGTGGTGNPIFNYGFTDTNVHYEDQSIGLGYNFFCSNIQVTGDTFHKSILGFIQMPNAHASVTDVRIDSVSTYGCIATGQCTGPATNNAIYLEGVTDIAISGGSVSDFTGQQGAVFCVGSRLQIPEPGPIMQLPCSRVSVSGIKVTNTTGYSIYINGQSSDGSVQGNHNSIENTVVTNATECPIIVSTSYAVMEGNMCDTTANGGYSLGRVTHASFRNNRGHNLGMAVAGNYVGLLINDPATQDITVEGNQFTEDNGHSLRRCFDDETLATGHDSAIKQANNVCTGASVNWYPSQPK